MWIKHLSVPDFHTCFAGTFPPPRWTSNVHNENWTMISIYQSSMTNRKKNNTTTYNLFFLHSLNHLYHVLTSIIIHASSTSSSSSTFSVIHHHHHWSRIRTTPDPVEKWLAKILACIYSSVFLILNIFFFFYNEFGTTPWGIAVLVILCHGWITNTAMPHGVGPNSL